MKYEEEMTIYREIPTEDMICINASIFSNTINDVFQLIGAGTFGTVYKFKNYAIKFFEDPDEINDDPFILNKLLNCPYYPNVYYCVYDYFMVYEYIDGILYSDSNQKVNIYNDIKKAVDYSFTQEFIPFDVHQDNIMIIKNQAVIVDVGRFFPFSHLNKEVIESYRKEIYQQIQEDFNIN